MKLILEMYVDAPTMPAEALEELGKRVADALTGYSGPHMHPRLLVELTPNYLELPIRARSHDEKPSAKRL